MRQRIQTALEEILEASIRFTCADFGNIQLYNPAEKVLRLSVMRGFDETFCDTFGVVGTDDNTARGRSIRTGARVVIEDVGKDSGYAPYRKTAAAADYRAVQSTPLRDRQGRLLGVSSTHWRKLHRPTEQDLRMLDLYARQAMDCIARTQAGDALRESQAKLCATPPPAQPAAP